MSIEAMKLALEAWDAEEFDIKVFQMRMENCRQAIEQAEQAQPVMRNWRHVIPGRRRTDQWDSARVADYNEGWNDCQKKTLSELEKLYASPTPSQPEQAQPVAWMNEHGDCVSSAFKQAGATYGDYNQPLYTAPPPRQPLTDEEIASMWREATIKPALTSEFVRGFARAIEAAHGIKENT